MQKNPFPCHSGSLDLGGDLGLAVDDLDAELLGAGDDVDSLAG